MANGEWRMETAVGSWQRCKLAADGWRLTAGADGWGWRLASWRLTAKVSIRHPPSAIRQAPA
ncbi:MAG TPA: hypothetical protein VMN03_16260 [Burkholderiales bacterium]|nr:hypothetical protein [Burkholderiales bacterium]